MGRDKDFNKGLRWSLALHGALGLFVLLKTLVFPGEPKPYTPSLRVDIVGLPDHLKNELQRLPRDLPKGGTTEDLSKALQKAQEDAQRVKKTQAESRPTAAKPEKAQASSDELTLNPKKAPPSGKEDRQKKLKSALDRIKALSKISDSESQSPAPAAKSAPLLKGNRISKGTSLQGDARESQDSGYYDLLKDRLQENWLLPVWIARQNLSARIRIQIDPRGRLKGFQFVKPSGNAQFDEAVKRALTESQPFPFPPEEIASSVLVDGILIGFPL